MPDIRNPTAQGQIFPGRDKPEARHAGVKDPKRLRKVSIQEAPPDLPILRWGEKHRVNIQATRLEEKCCEMLERERRDMIEVTFGGQYPRSSQCAGEPTIRTDFASEKTLPQGIHIRLHDEPERPQDDGAVCRVSPNAFRIGDIRHASVHPGDIEAARSAAGVKDDTEPVDPNPYLFTRTRVAKREIHQLVMVCAADLVSRLVAREQGPKMSLSGLDRRKLMRANFDHGMIFSLSSMANPGCVVFFPISTLAFPVEIDVPDCKHVDREEARKKSTPQLVRPGALIFFWPMPTQ